MPEDQHQAPSLEAMKSEAALIVEQEAANSASQQIEVQAVNDSIEQTQENDEPKEPESKAPESSGETQSIDPKSNAMDSAFKTEDPQVIKEQLKYCATILKGLKRHRDGSPFLVPVDPIALGIPDYPKIITNPMDLSTIARKLEGNEYPSAPEFIADVRLMLNNCFTFNAPDSQVAKMGRNLERYFNNCLVKMPVNMEQASALAVASPRRKSESVGSPMATRPRREASTPTTRRGSNSSNVYSAPASFSSSTSKGKRPSGDITFCRQVINELTKKTHQHLNWPFMQPVDPVALGIPDYFTVIKNPMDLGTIKRKLDNREYQNAEQFESDVRLVFSNCYTYNAPDTDVVQMAKALEAVFESKWAQRPSRAAPVPTAPVASSHHRVPLPPHDLGDDERILIISQQITAWQAELNEILQRKASGKYKPSTAASAYPSQNSTITHHHTALHHQQHPPQQKKKSTGMTEEFLTRPMTFDEKKQLSDAVNELAPENLLKVLEIIHDSKPDLKDDAESGVIEVDVETLDVRTLRKLQHYVKSCSKKRKQPSQGGSQKKSAPATQSHQQSNNSSTEAVPFPVESSDESSDESGDE